MYSKMEKSSSTWFKKSKYVLYLQGYWTTEEDRQLRQLLKNGIKSWKIISKHIVGRTPKQCRERWKSHLNPNILKG